MASKTKSKITRVCVVPAENGFIVEVHMENGGYEGKQYIEASLTAAKQRLDAVFR